MLPKLRHDHQALLDSLLAGKLPRNLQWKDVLELMSQVGEVQPASGDETSFICGSQRENFKRPHSQALDVETASRLRKFLRQGLAAGSPSVPEHNNRVIVVVDRHGAHLYKEAGDEKFEPEAKVSPHDPFHFQHHLIHRKEAHYQGERAPEEGSFYDEIAKRLADAEEIILIGHGTGQSSAVDYLAEYLKTHHFTIYQHVIATEKADLSALTPGQIEAIAKKHLVREIQSSPTKTDRYDRPHIAEAKAS
jgi:hypothetical protein